MDPDLLSMTDWQVKLQDDTGVLQIGHQGGDKVIEIYTSTPKSPKATLLMAVPLAEFGDFVTKLYNLSPGDED